jgi:hypothetical protein
MALALGAGAASASALTLSPELQTLEAKSRELKITSERFTLDYIIKPATGQAVTIMAAGDARTSPPRAEIKETVRGKRIAVRVVGSSLYLEYPGLARLDHGRPWVRSSQSQLSAESGINPLSATGGFASSYALLGSEAEVEERVGPASVNGQETTEFTATVDLDRLTSLFSAKLRGELEKAGVATARVAIFIAADGMPLQTVVDLAVEGGTITVSTSIVQVNGPVSVSAPPAGRTISQAAFKRLAKRLEG